MCVCGVVWCVCVHTCCVCKKTHPDVFHPSCMIFISALFDLSMHAACVCLHVFTCKPSFASLSSLHVDKLQLQKSFEISDALNCKHAEK